MNSFSKLLLLIKRPNPLYRFPKSFRGLADERREYRHDNHWLVLILAGVYRGWKNREQEGWRASFGCTHAYTLSGVRVCRVCTCMFDSEAEWQREGWRRGIAREQGGNRREKKGEFSRGTSPGDWHTHPKTEPTPNLAPT